MTNEYGEDAAPNVIDWLPKPPEPTVEIPDVAPNATSWAAVVNGTPPIPAPYSPEPAYDPYTASQRVDVNAGPRNPSPGLMDAYGAAQQASMGFFTGSNPAESLSRARAGLFEGAQYDPNDLGFVRNMEPGPARDALARAEAQLVDPINLATLPFGPAVRAGIGFGIGAEEVARPVARALGASPETEAMIGAGANVAGNFLTPEGIRSGVRLAREAAPDILATARRLALDETGTIRLAAGDPSQPARAAATTPSTPVEAPASPPAAPPPAPPAPPPPPGGAGVPPTGTGAGGDPVQALLKALDDEVNLRRSGVPEAEISAGRTRQAGRAQANLENLPPDATLEERMAAARRGMATGPLRETFNAPLDLAPEQVDALAARVQEVLTGEGNLLSINNGFEALNNLVTGQNVMPHQIRLLQRIFGDDVAELATRANKARVSPVATLSPERLARIEDARKRRETGVARQEERAAAQLEHANELAKQARMDPTNKRLPAAVEAAKRRALDAQNRADAALVNQVQNMLGKPEDAAASLAQQKAVFERVNALREAEAAIKAGTATPEQAVLVKARDLLGRKLSVMPELRDEQMRSIGLWLEGNRAILDQIGETTHRRLRAAAAAVTGDLADSWLTTLYQRRVYLARVFEQQGWEPRIANRVMDVLTANELATRYPQGVPERILAEIRKTKAGQVGPELDNVILRGAAAASQEWKNLAFGPADVGVFGQQVLKAFHQAGGAFLTGVVNNALNAMHMGGIDTRLIDEIALSKRLQYQLDGVAQGVSTGIVQNARRGVLGRLGTEAHNVGRIVDRLSDWQFGTVLGGMRNLIHEGNLVALHLAGQDITNPAVRAQAAAFANAATSYAPTALNETRALVERATLMTPSMRRAQVASILQMARVFAPRATASERILGSMTILNLVGATLVVGKGLNDLIGVEDFEMDPSKPGFGNITTKLVGADGKHIVISLFPQQQVMNTILKATRALAESDPQAAAREWGKLVMGSSGPVAQLAEKAAGYGYQPGKGYRFGDLKGGLLNVLPMPPVVQSYFTGDLSPQTIIPELTGFTSYAEGGAAAVKRGDYGSLRGESQLTAINDGGRGQGWRSVVTSPRAPAGLSQYESYYDWRDAKRAELRPEIEAMAAQRRAAALAAGNATEAAKYAPEKIDAAIERAVKNDPVQKAYDRARSQLETEWVRENPQLTIDLYEKWKGMSFADQMEHTDWHFSQEQLSLARTQLAGKATPAPYSRAQVPALAGATRMPPRPPGQGPGLGQVRYEDGSIGPMPPQTMQSWGRDAERGAEPLYRFGQPGMGDAGTLRTLPPGSDTPTPPNRNLDAEFAGVVKRNMKLTPEAETVLGDIDWARENQGMDNWAGNAPPGAINVKRSVSSTEALDAVVSHEFTHSAQQRYVPDLTPFVARMRSLSLDDDFARASAGVYPQLHAFYNGAPRNADGDWHNPAGWEPEHLYTSVAAFYKYNRSAMPFELAQFYPWLAGEPR